MATDDGGALLDILDVYIIYSGHLYTRYCHHILLTHTICPGYGGQVTLLPGLYDDTVHNGP